MSAIDSDSDRLAFFKGRGFNPQSIVDIGASDGRWSMDVASVFPEAEYHLFEPQAELIPDFKNALGPILESHPNFHLHPFAVGEAPGEITLKVDRNSPFGTTTLEVANPDKWFDSHVIPVETLDGMIKQGTLPVPQLLKADIQGGELAVLKGAEENLASVELILLECWLTRGYGPSTPLYHEIAEWLRERHFHWIDLGGFYRNPDGYLISQDLFFVREDSELAEPYRFDFPKRRKNRAGKNRSEKEQA